MDEIEKEVESKEDKIPLSAEKVIDFIDKMFDEEILPEGD